MKKLIIVGFSAALLAGGFSSCKKTSKGKMANEWSVSSIESKSTDTDENGTSSTLVSVTDKTLTITDTDQEGDVTTINGTVQDYSYTIDKDGKWNSVYNFTLTTTQEVLGTNFTTTNVYTTSSNGTWNFLGGVEEFKTNERVIFNTLAEEETIVTTTTGGGANETSTESESITYANGEEAMVYLVVESKSKELELSSEEDFSITTNSTGSSAMTSSSTEAVSIKLVQK